MDTPERKDAWKYDEYDNGDVTRDEDLPMDVKNFSAKMKAKIERIKQRREQTETLKPSDQEPSGAAPDR